MKKASWVTITSGLLLLTAGCRITTQEAEVTALGAAVSTEDMQAQLAHPGPIALERIHAANWAVDREGLINLEHPRAISAGLEEGPEPIQIYFYAIRHPIHGLFLIDSGVERAFVSGEDTALSGLVKSAMNMETLEVHVDTKTWLERQSAPLRGIFLTHLHVDHIMGLTDAPSETPIYVGPGEHEATAFMNMFVQGTTDRALQGKQLKSWKASEASSGAPRAVTDVFGDGSLFALHVPGHTPGSMAFVARTPDGAVLIAGDTCHTAWGWNNDVEPGEFTSDHESNASQLAALRALAAQTPNMKVYLGHQDLAPAVAAAQ